MKNIAKKINKTFYLLEFDSEIEPFIPHSKILEILFYLSPLIFLIGFLIDTPETVFGFFLMFIPGLYVSIILTQSWILYPRLKMNIIAYFKLREKNINEFRKEFDSVENLMNIYNELKENSIELKDEYFYKLYNESKNKKLNKESIELEVKIKKLDSDYKKRKKKNIKKILNIKEEK